MTLYYIGHAKSEKINAYLAVTDNEETAKELLESIEGATCIVKRQYDDKGQPVK